MSHEPGRERHMQRRCEHCQLTFGDFIYNEDCDEYWCVSCLDNEAEAAYDRDEACKCIVRIEVNNTRVFYWRTPPKDRFVSADCLWLIPGSAS